MSEPAIENTAVSGGSGALERRLGEMGSAIEESQAALLAGRLRDLEASTRKQQELFAPLRDLISAPLDASDEAGGRVLPPKVIAAAQRVRTQNLVFAGVLKRMRRNLDALRRQMQGLELSYTCAGDGNSASGVHPENAGESRV